MSDTEILEGSEPGLERGQVRKKKVKVEGAPSPSWVDPLYAEQPTIAWNRVDPISRNVFEEKYGLCNKGVAPRRLKYGVHLEESEVDEMFGPKVNNGYRYSWSEDVEFVKKVERLWMITHQRTQVPNTRLINVSEAKGLVYEITKKKDVNWCVHAEWSCRDQLRRINIEEDAAKLGRATGLDLNEDDLEGGAIDSAQRTTSEVRQTVSGQQRTVSGVVLESKLDFIAMAIGEWQEYLSLLEKEAPTLDGLVSRLCKEKDERKIELVKVSSQVDYGRSLLANAERRLTVLQAEHDECKMKLEALKGEDPQSATNIGAAVNALANVQKKVDSQVGVLDQFRGLFGSGEVDHEDSIEKSRIAEENWVSAVQKQELWKRHRAALSGQLKGMKSGYQRPALHPAPLPFLYLECQTIYVPAVGVEIVACPFCTSGFEPAWDCKLSSCRHAYHSWCAFTHFSKQSKCMFKDCNAEQHEDWWVMAGINKPQSETNGLQMELWDNWKPENMVKDFEGKSSV